MEPARFWLIDLLWLIRIRFRCCVSRSRPEFNITSHAAPVNDVDAEFDHANITYAGNTSIEAELDPRRATRSASVRGTRISSIV